MTIIPTVYFVVRGVIVAALACSLVVAATHWAVRRRTLNAFGAWPRFVRRTSDPLLQPIERRIIRSGGNPQDAPLWLLGIVIVLGLVILWLLGWVTQGIAMLAVLARGGPSDWAYAAARVLFGVLKLALIVRVVGSWIRLSPTGWPARTAHALTNWLVRPIRTFLPSFGPFDFSPMVAWILISWILEPLVLRLLAGPTV
ncbi:MAG: YggT family protein [Gemmatimonadales bacterium]|nr:YggT family protein [Gemmatimonadales bacterium]MBA3710603.1 YggT family protein [Planctomycetota bacterium]